MHNVYLIVLGVGSFFSGLDPAWIALVGTLFGGVGLKLIEWWLSRNKIRAEQQQAFARDYRAEIKELTDRVNEAEKSEGEWREKYWSLRDSQTSVKSPDVVE